MIKVTDKVELLKKKVDSCEYMLELLTECTTLENKMDVLESFENVRVFSWPHRLLIDKLSLEEKIALKSVVAIGQGENVLGNRGSEEQFKMIVDILFKVEKFYDTIGGIIGYHYCVLQRIFQELLSQNKTNENDIYHKPLPFDILKPNEEVWDAIRTGVENLPLIGEMYPIGGAGDRLRLVDESTGEPLPAAMLLFCGRTLLEGMIRDIQAREFLYNKLCGKQLVMPLALMTSEEKDNHQFILETCEDNEWFGRPKDKIRLFMQPLVPVVSETGVWIMQDALKLSLKPGGHGVLWKKASDEGVLDWFQSLGCRKLLVRQINNPVASTDYGILATMGHGVKEDKSFGIASCRRIVNNAEGMDVLCEREINDGFEYCITNIEYTEFQKKGIKDVPEHEGSNYSVFPTNTNILFVDIESIKNALKVCPIPGMLINMKTKFKHICSDGTVKYIKGGRLESTMQNIADVMVDKFSEKMDVDQKIPLKTFITYNRRRKTISVTKSSFEKGKKIDGTPIGGYYEMLQNYYELLSEYCNIKLPSVPDENVFVENGPSFITLFHPAIGPCWDIIAQKISEGTFAEGAELQLEVAEINIKNIDLMGSLLVEAKDLLGKKDANRIIQYGHECGKCTLIDVKIRNKGIDREANNTYWSNNIKRYEALRIILHGNAEFHAQNVTIDGDQFIEVPDGYRVTVQENCGELIFNREKINKPTWFWKYEFSDGNHIILKKSK